MAWCFPTLKQHFKYSFGQIYLCHSTHKFLRNRAKKICTLKCDISNHLSNRYRRYQTPNIIGIVSNQLLWYRPSPLRGLSRWRVCLEILMSVIQSLPATLVSSDNIAVPALFFLVIFIPKLYFSFLFSLQFACIEPIVQIIFISWIIFSIFLETKAVHHTLFPSSLNYRLFRDKVLDAEHKIHGNVFVVIVDFKCFQTTFGQHLIII